MNINPSAALGLNLGAQLGLGGLAQIGAGLQLQMAAGIMGQFFNPLNAGPYAFAQLPAAFMIRCFGGGDGGQPMPGNFLVPGNPCIPAPGFPGLPGLPEPVAQWGAQTTGRHTANVDLGDGYTLKIDERQSEMSIFNANTGETTRIWGDPHVDVDGKRAFDFWGTTTFTLENGTKLTINTEQFGKNPNEYVSSQVVITKGDQAMVIDGVSQNQLGDLSISMSNNGQLIDAMHRDGFVLQENATGTGWRSEWTGDIATQKDLNATRVGAEFGPGSEAMSLEESGQLLGGFLMNGLISLMLLGAMGGSGAYGR